jgi:hypothetical protein
MSLQYDNFKFDLDVKTKRLQISSNSATISVAVFFQEETNADSDNCDWQFSLAKVRYLKRLIAL